MSFISKTCRYFVRLLFSFFMKIIIAGAGEVGTLLTKMLSQQNHEITVIDPSVDRLQYIDNHYDVTTLLGASDSLDLLREAGVKKADLLVAVNPNHQLNIISGILGKKLGAKKTIARIDNDEYLFSKNKQYFLELGIDSLIYPEKLAANEVIGLLNQTGTTEMVDFSGGLLSLYVIKLDENAPIINHTLEEALQNSKNFNYRAVAIHREGRTIIPRGSDIFHVGDLVHVITNKEGIPTLMEFSGKKKVELKNLMIIGGSRIGRRVAKKLQSQFSIKLIEYNKDLCYQLSEELHNTLIINADGRNMDLLIEEEINRMDALIAVTGHSETNILACLAAKQFGVKKTIAEIENIDYIDLAENINVDTIINKKLIAASHIYSFTLGDEIRSVKCLTGTDADVLEYVAKPGSRITRGQIRDLEFPKGAIIGGIIRGEQSIIAKGDTLVLDHDIVVVFSLPSVVQKVEKFFQ